MNYTPDSSVTAYIGLGSNLSSPVQQVLEGRLEISALTGVTETAFSSLYRSSPMGPQDQPDYVNAVMAVHTTLTASTLLHSLQAIEDRHHRVRLERWGARTLDLDLLLFGNQQIHDPELTVPHPGIARRAFVLYPLGEIAEPSLSIPGLGMLQDLMLKCPPNDLEILTQ